MPVVVFEIRREAIKIVMKDGRRTGEAFVKFRSPIQATDAIRALNMKRMGKRFVELYQADYYDADRISIL
jgi:RNA recognition motif-containing protein